MQEVGGMSYEKAQGYRLAIFSLVQNKEHWKNPIVASIPLNCTEVGAISALQSAIEDSIIHFTGSTPYFRVADGVLHVQAAGYFATVGA